MSDAVVLLALSQMVCLGGLAYLYSQVMKLRAGNDERRASDRALPLRQPVEIGLQVPETHRVRRAPARSRAAAMDVALVAKKMNELGLDVPALAQRMNRSEDEIRLLLRRKGAA